MNVSVIASNVFESFTHVLTFEMVGKVQGPLIDDFQIISNKEQLKEFEITFESIGSGTCMMLDFKDGTQKVWVETLKNGWSKKSCSDLRRQELLRGVAAGREVRPRAGGGHQPPEDLPHLLVSSQSSSLGSQ